MKHICKYCGKEFESGQKLGGHTIKCENNPNKGIKRDVKNSLKFIKYNDNTNICNCQFCQKECKGLNSLKQHEIRCKDNPNKINSYIPGFNNKGRISWNAGLTKESDERIKKSSQILKNKYDSGEIKVWSKGLTKENDERLAKLSSTLKSNHNAGGYRDKSGHGKSGKYKGIFLKTFHIPATLKQPLLVR